jgi:tetratricopeptide (TPR) repeat protein
MGQLKRRRDVRMRALLLTGGLVVAGGLSIAYLPGKWHTSLVSGSKEVRAAHAREKTEAEIRERFEQGVSMLNARKYEEALKSFHRVLELSPDMPEAHVNAGFALLGLQHYAVARDFFEGAIELRKNQLNAYYGLAEALGGLNDLQGALGAMSTYLHLAPLDDPYRQKAASAISEWRSRVAQTMHSTALADRHANAPAQAERMH